MAPLDRRPVSALDRAWQRLTLRRTAAALHADREGPQTGGHARGGGDAPLHVRELCQPAHSAAAAIII